MKNKIKKDSVQYSKERIEDFSRYNEEEATKFLESIKYGTVVMAYPISLENDIYRYVSKIIYGKYPQYTNEDEIFKILSSYGHIYTAKIRDGLGCGLYHINSASILLYSFLNKLNENLLHELVHKLGYLQFNEDFYNMSKIYIEAGTDLITNTILEKPLCREVILGKIWTRSVGVQPRYLSEVSLINQLNKALGNDVLERSILQGKDYIQANLEETIGKDKARLLYTKFTDILRLENLYWTGKKRELDELKIYDKICDFQEILLREIWDKRIKGAKSRQEAEIILNELMNFSDYRVRYGIPIQKDDLFKKYFEEKKQFLEEKFNSEFIIQDITDIWQERYPVILLDKSELDEEKNEKSKIDIMAKKKKQESKSFFSRFISSKNRKKELNNNTQVMYMNESSLDYIKEVSNNCVTSNVKKENKKRNTGDFQK